LTLRETSGTGGSESTRSNEYVDCDKTVIRQAQNLEEH
jgi:hypothetical protein